MTVKSLFSAANKSLIRKTRSVITHNILQRVIYLCFGGREGEAPLVESLRRVADYLHLPYQTVQGIVRRYRMNGFSIEYNKPRTGRRKTWVPPEILDYLQSQEVLEEHAYLSLKQRCTLIEDYFGIRMGPKMLRRIFSDLGISNSRPKLVHEKAKREERALEVQRKDFALRLRQLIRDGALICYIDETTLNTWSRRKLTWQKAGKPI